MPTAITFVDIAGLVKGASVGEGLGNQFLSHIKSATMILEVVRDFEDPEIIREHSKNPDEDAEIIETELRLKDIESLEKKLDSIKKDSSKKEEAGFLSLLQEKMSSGEELDISERDAGNEKISVILKELNFLSLKPKIYAFNTDASKIGASDKKKTHRLKPVIYFSAKTGGGLDDLIKTCYKTLNLISFLTVGRVEARAWTVKQGASAKEAAGVIHSDFEKNFIRAKVIGWQKLISTGSFADASSKGLIRTEGKNYVMQDGDVVEFLIGK